MSSRRKQSLKNLIPDLDLLQKSEIKKKKCRYKYGAKKNRGNLLNFTKNQSLPLERITIEVNKASKNAVDSDEMQCDDVDETDQLDLGSGFPERCNEDAIDDESEVEIDDESENEIDNEKEDEIDDEKEDEIDNDDALLVSSRLFLLIF